LDGAPVDASFVVEGGQVRLLAGKDGVVCCAPDGPTKVLAALQVGRHEIELATTSGPPELTTAEAQSLGIKEEIGQPDAFGPTTRHKGGEPRVNNIHKIADIVRGHVILPGETFSVNGLVGKRTTAKGFVEAGVIYKGKFEHDIGGGVSQFATTTFNAALFAGLDFGEYQSHSIFIDRYPKGHEATISYPHPDLEIKNTTPFGVLVWPTYTSTSITVHLYSTKLATVELTAPTARPQGNCTRWTTTRIRSYPDGSKKTDSVFALYRPGEGIDC
jgi:vancomycin resistance protein YoaR